MPYALTHMEPCKRENIKSITAAFPHAFDFLFTCPTAPNVGVSRVLFHVGSLFACGRKNATVGKCHDQSQERRVSVRAVRGIPLPCGLDDISNAAVYLDSLADSELHKVTKEAIESDRIHRREQAAQLKKQSQTIGRQVNDNVKAQSEAFKRRAQIEQRMREW